MAFGSGGERIYHLTVRLRDTIFKKVYNEDGGFPNKIKIPGHVEENECISNYMQKC